MPVNDPLLTITSSLGRTSTDPSRPDYACPAYQDMAPYWQLVTDVRAGTITVRQKCETYLPKFEAESAGDWAARVNMSFVQDHYAATLQEHVGLVFATPPKLGDDVPPRLKELFEDIDGEGRHLDVFATDAFDAALDLGHCVLFTDYPPAVDIKTKADERAMQARPYVTLYKACDVLNARYETVGGVKVLVQIMFRERGMEPDGEYGQKECVRYREIQQAVIYGANGRAQGLGPITWRAWKDETVNDVSTFTPIGEGTITGPDRICARVVYGGERLGLMQSRPHLVGLAFTNVEETQVGSDYANVMHKCNVPTPIFIGRNISDGTNQTVRMGQGLDIPTGGDAKMLEPTGVALDATRHRIEDLRGQMRRQGATTADATGKVMTAAEAQMYAKQRNAKLSRAARSLQDALEGVFADMAAFLGIDDGGSIVINQDFAGVGIDPQYLAVLIQAYDRGALPLEALMYALEKGQLPEDFQAEDAALLLITEQLARKNEPPVPAPTPGAPVPA
jgi:hypothetical protein